MKNCKKKILSTLSLKIFRCLATPFDSTRSPVLVSFSFFQPVLQFNTDHDALKFSRASACNRASCSNKSIMSKKLKHNKVKKHTSNSSNSGHCWCSSAKPNKLMKRFFSPMVLGWGDKILPASSQGAAAATLFLCVIPNEDSNALIQQQHRSKHDYHLSDGNKLQF